jgi:hypothetical protein
VKLITGTDVWLPNDRLACKLKVKARTRRHGSSLHPCNCCSLILLNNNFSAEGLFFLRFAKVLL